MVSSPPTTARATSSFTTPLFRLTVTVASRTTSGWSSPPARAPRVLRLTASSRSDHPAPRRVALAIGWRGPPRRFLRLRPRPASRTCHPDAMPSEPGPPDPRTFASAQTKLLVSLAAAIAAGAAAAAAGVGRAAPLIGWDVLALVFCAWLWATIWRLDPAATATHAQREEPNRDLADLVLLGAAIASLVAVGAVLFRASGASGNLKYLEAGFALASVFVSWTLIHTVFTLKYARLYYCGEPGGN